MDDNKDQSCLQSPTEISAYGTEDELFESHHPLLQVGGNRLSPELKQRLEKLFQGLPPMVFAEPLTAEKFEDSLEEFLQQLRSRRYQCPQ